MNVLVVIIGVIAVFVIIRAYVLNIGKNEDSTKQRRAEIAARIREKEKTAIEVQPIEDPEYNYYSFNVVGMKYRSRPVKKFIDRMCGAELVELKPEPRNQYDKNAIKVLVYDEDKMKDICIGYVPADEAIEVGELIDENPHHKCSIDYLHCDLDSDYFSISVEIKY